MILGISGSGRKDRMIHQTVRTLLEKTGLEYDIVSLAGKKINGCIGCTACASDNICKVKDDWNAIGEKMLKANMIVFGAPNYYGMINALAHACLERTFCFRHRDAFLLKNKYGVSINTSRHNSENDAVKDTIQKFMRSNQIHILGHITVDDYSQCFTCGFGKDCEAGSVVGKWGVLEEIEAKHLPNEVVGQEFTLKAIHALVEKIKATL
jgi:multimeric flavodoxin WrbA